VKQIEEDPTESLAALDTKRTMTLNSSGNKMDAKKIAAMFHKSKTTNYEEMVSPQFNHHILNSARSKNDESNSSKVKKRASQFKVPAVELEEQELDFRELDPLADFYSDVRIRLQHH
jgi:hypothetical protein